MIYLKFLYFYLIRFLIISIKKREDYKVLIAKKDFEEEDRTKSLVFIILDIIDNSERNTKVESLESSKCDKDDEVTNNRKRFIRFYMIR